MPVAWQIATEGPTEMSRDAGAGWRSRALAGAVVVSVLAAAAVARGQIADPPGGDADRLFREGIALREAGDTAGAVDRLRRSHRIDPAPRTTYNLAAALAEHGRYVEARFLLRRLLASGGDDLLTHDAARALLDEVGRSVATVRVQIEGAGPGQVVVVDGTREAEAQRELQLDPGAHRIEVQSRSGSVLARSEVELSPGERTEVVLAPVGAPEIASRFEAPRPAPSDATLRHRDDSTETWIWVGVGAGAVVVLGAVIVGTVLAISSSQGAGVDGDLPDVHVRGAP